jgi:hypothetical protein
MLCNSSVCIVLRGYCLQALTRLAHKKKVQPRMTQNSMYVGLVHKGGTSVFEGIIRTEISQYGYDNMVEKGPAPMVVPTCAHLAHLV